MGSLEEYEKTNLRISRGLSLWLNEVHGIKGATDCAVTESEVERGWSTGCDTCGYGADDDKVYFYVWYTDDGGEGWRKSVRVEGTNVNFLPEILPYIDRAN